MRWNDWRRRARRSDKLKSMDTACLLITDGRKRDFLLLSSAQDRLMTKRMDRMKIQTDLKQLQTYRSNLDSFEVSLEHKASELNNELESSGKSEQYVPRKYAGLPA